METVTCCPQHAPIGVRAIPSDDARYRCGVCGLTGYNVKRFELKSEVIDQGWRMENFDKAPGRG